MNRFGLLLTITEPPPQHEAEFNAWYDTEHIVERVSIPGFLSARRWLADVKPGEGKYLATYELDSPVVLASTGYLSRFESQSPWSRRCLGKAVVFRRWACEQLDPGRADAHPGATAIVFATEDLSLPATLQKRRFAASSGETIFLHELSERRVALPAAARLYRAYDA